MSTSAFSRSTETQKNLTSGLTRLSNEAIPVLRFAKESVSGIGIPGPEAALGGVLAVAKMIQVRDFILYGKLYHATAMYQDMQSNKEDLAKLKPNLEELIKVDTSGWDGDLKKRLTELALYAPLLGAQVQD
jgi:hypothetical protein